MKYAVLFWFVAVGCAQPPVLDLMPTPAKVHPGQGRLTIDSSFAVALEGYNDPRVVAAVKRLESRLHFTNHQSGRATLVIRCEHAGAPVQKLGEEESYRLEVTPAQARLTAPNALGVLRGIETFVQLVQSKSVLAVTIEDQPRFPWRGLHMDVSRHFMPLDVVLRNLDAMAAVKLNVFHWHLSDDQGFRVECKRYPKLHELGSDGQYYTQEQVRQVVAYARDRGIRVVPEFDVPAHSSAWLVGYPELGGLPGPYRIARTWGILDPAMDPVKETTLTFLDNFIAEMAGLFPDEFFHIGGDEVNGKQWNASPSIVAYKKKEGIGNEALHAQFNRRLQGIVRKHGKRMEGWDEILNPDLQRDIVIQSWRGLKSLADAARLGYAGLLSTPYYLDAMKPASEMYGADPWDKEAAALNAEEKMRILGGEVCMWAEFVTPENIDSRLWPRTAAIAERFWSPAEVSDVDSMYRRLAMISRELESLGVKHVSNYRMMLERLAGDGPVEPLRTLADVVTPVRLGGRQRARRYTQQTPLNRLCDTAAPESMAARQFAGLVENRNWVEARAWLIRWRDNHAALEPGIARNALTRELLPLSVDLASLGAIGLQAIEAISSGHRPEVAWIAQQRSFLEIAKMPRAELILQPVASVAKLIDLAAAIP